jgi:putative DNA methylase
MQDDRRLIEDYLPIEAISAEASREKSVRKGHISTLHLWWARRPLVACRAAVYGALVPAARFVPEGAGDGKKKSLGRANAAKFVDRLCKYPGDHRAIAEAQRHILEAHAERLTRETGKPVTVADIEAGRAPRPKVLDMFAGGGAIPLEALRLGCEAYALDLNPVAHIIQLCTLVYPQKYGKPDPTAHGMTGPANAKNETTWGGLAKEVRYWGEWVLKKVKAEIGDLYPLIPDPAYKEKREPVKDIFGTEAEVPPGYLVPVAYLWTRTVTCKNPTCKAIVPLFGQSWLRKKTTGYTALRPVVRKDRTGLDFELTSATTEAGIGFDPSDGISGTTTVCRCCSANQDAEYVRKEGEQGRYGQQLMAAICQKPGSTGKVYLADRSLAKEMERLDAEALSRAESLLQLFTVNSLSELIPPSGNAGYATGKSYLHGIVRFRQAFTPRQLATLLTLCKFSRDAMKAVTSNGGSAGHVEAIGTYLALIIGRCVDRGCSLVRWNNIGEKIESFSSFKRYAMMWDFPEVNLLASGSGNATDNIGWVVDAIESCCDSTRPGDVSRGDAANPPWTRQLFDAIVTDPPYYDNESYAELSDMFYIWHRFVLFDVHPEHTASQLTPKKKMIVAAAYLHGGTKDAGARFYESALAQSLNAANAALKEDGSLVLVYAHKTTLGWATLVDAVRRARFSIEEAWPLTTEKKGRAAHQDDSALANSIFLVGRKCSSTATGSYETEVGPELESIISERVETLWDLGVSGADLVIACVGAGLRAFTRFARVEYANGEEVPAERFLTEVETVVLDSILARLSKEAGGNGGRYSLAGVDPATRFYTLWRYTYRSAELDAGEAIVFANGTHVELDGPNGMSSGARALVEKKKGKYRLRDFTERGDDDKLGMPSDDAQSAPLIDALHRTLWLMEHRPRQLGEFFREAQPNREQMRLVAQALAGPALKGGELGDISPTGELAALAKLTANWRSVVEENVFTPDEQADRKRGQRKLFE